MGEYGNCSLERVLKIDRERNCERGGADGETRRRRIFERNLQLRSNEASRPAPPQDRPIYFQSTLLSDWREHLARRQLLFPMLQYG